MTSASQEVLKTMRNEREGSSPKEKIDPYSKLLIHKSLRRTLIFLSFLALVAMTALLASRMKGGDPWWVTGLSPVGIGLLLSLFPLTEFWDYKPWQSQPRRYEHHHVEKM